MHYCFRKWFCRCRKRDSRPSQWEKLLKTFAQSLKEECDLEILEMPKIARSLKTFPTGSSYLGTWDVLGMSGEGTYTFPNGVEYKGQFKDGMFHGSGELRYPCGSVIKGKWQNGVIYERTLVFPDSVHYSEHNWRYCTENDRRFAIEYKKGLQPAGRSYMTAKQPTRAIPPGYYDTGDGFYDPKSKAIYHANDLSSIIRSPNVREQQWIVDNCRFSSGKNMGPCSKLYNEWSKANPEPRNIKMPTVTCDMGTKMTFLSHSQASEVQILNFPNLKESTSSLSVSTDSEF